MRGIESNTVINVDVPKQAEISNTTTYTSSSKVNWTMPSDKKVVTMTHFNKYGRQIASYTVTDYITMTPGDTYVIEAK